MYIKGQIEANKSNISYRNHLLEKYNSIFQHILLLHMPYYIFYYICRLYNPAKYFILNVNL